jgi:hypothetical protein
LPNGKLICSFRVRLFVDTRPRRPDKVAPRFDRLTLRKRPTRNVLREPNVMRLIMLYGFFHTRMAASDMEEPAALNIAQSDDDRIERIGKITSAMAELQEQNSDALRMKLRRGGPGTYRTVTRELDAARDQLARKHEHVTNEAAIARAARPIVPQSLNGRSVTETAVCDLRPGSCAAPCCTLAIAAISAAESVRAVAGGHAAAPNDWFPGRSWGSGRRSCR